MRIVRVANFVAPHSGGLRTCLRELGAGYLAAGHEPVLVIPGERDSDERTGQGRVITLRGPRIPFTGRYRVLLRKRQVAALLEDLRPDTLEVSDRTTLRWTGRWAREHGVPAVMMSHESLTALLRMALPGLDLPVLTRSAAALALVDAVNRRTAAAYHLVIGLAAATVDRPGPGAGRPGRTRMVDRSRRGGRGRGAGIGLAVRERVNLNAFRRSSANFRDCRGVALGWPQGPRPIIKT